VIARKEDVSVFGKNGTQVLETYLPFTKGTVTLSALDLIQHSQRNKPLFQIIIMHCLNSLPLKPSFAGHSLAIPSCFSSIILVTGLIRIDREYGEYDT